MYHLIKKAVAVRKHLERNRGDKDSKLCVHTPSTVLLLIRAAA